MKITIISGAFLPIPPVAGGAIERFMFVLAQEFVRRGHDVTIVARTWNGQPREETLAGVKIKRMASSNRRSSALLNMLIDFFYSLRAVWIAPEADLTVTNTFFSPVLLSSRKAGRIYVHVARTPRGQMRLYGKAQRLQAVSSAVAESIRQESAALAEKVVVIPYALPEAFLDVSAPPLSTRPQRVLYVGRVAREKGLELLIKAFARAQRTEWSLRVVGPADIAHGGDGDAFQSGLAAVALNEGVPVEFAGPSFDLSSLMDEYTSSQIFVYPSMADGETFGLSALEAMACGSAVVVSGLACFKDFADDDANAVIFDHCADDPLANLATALANLMDDPERRARIAAAGVATASNYTIEHVGAAYLQDAFC